MDKVNEYVFDKKIPFNLEILKLTREVLNTLKEVKSVDVFAASKTEFDTEGLFSVEIFGQVGSKERMEKFGYIDLGLPIVHPLIYKNITSLKQFYKDIIEGKKYAVYDKKLKDFVESNITEGETGFNFFFDYYNQLEPPRTDSKERDNKIKLIKKYMYDDIEADKWLVLPAGLRDYIIKDNKDLENEINNYYRNILRISKTAKNLAATKISKDDPILNTIVLKLMKSIIDLYDYIVNLLDGKGGYLQGKYAKRGLAYGTRNVLTATPVNSKYLDKPALSFNETMIGLYQAAKAMTPLTIFNLNSRFLSNVFTEGSTDVYLINTKTLKQEQVTLTDKARSIWLSNDGLEEMLNKIKQTEILTSPIIIDKHYLFLVMDDGEHIELYRSKDECVEDKQKYLRPITYIELIYLAIYESSKELYGTVTRYPIDSNGSIYISKVKIRPTINTRTVKFKTLGGIEYKDVYEYPILTEKAFMSMVPHVSKLEALGGDYDGDKGNFNMILSEESKEEAKKLLSTREYYIDVSGELLFPMGNLITDLTLATLTE